MKTRFFMIALFVLNIFQMSAQSNDEVTLVVSADGATKEEATTIALRSAIEQAYGTFVSANTTILNDEMVKDEIVTISNGNIKKYDEIASLTLPNGNQSVTLQATVCISKLVSYAQSKGASTEFAGAAFAMNIKMMELNKKNEMIALNNLYEQVKDIVPLMYDRKLIVRDPVVLDNGDYKIKMKYRFVGNENKNIFYKILTQTLNSLCLSEKQLKEYKSMNMKYSFLALRATYVMGDVERGRLPSLNMIYYLRNNREDVFKLGLKLMYLLCREFQNFKITDNLGVVYGQGGSFDENMNVSSVEIGKINTRAKDISEMNNISYYYQNEGVNWLWFNLDPTFDLEVTIPKDYIMKIENFSIQTLFEDAVGLEGVNKGFLGGALGQVDAHGLGVGGLVAENYQ